jgi:hypothetical protein
MAKRFEFDARVNTTITVVAENEEDGARKAKAILDRLALIHADTEEEFSTDTEDGVELIDEEEISDEEAAEETAEL